MNADEAQARAQEIKDALRRLQHYSQQLIDELLAMEYPTETPTIEQFTAEDGQVIFAFPPTRFVLGERNDS